jgi:hypothetical protein
MILNNYVARMSNGAVMAKFMTLSSHLPEGTDNKYEKSSQRNAIHDKIQTGHLLNISQKCYYFSQQLGAVTQYVV